MCQKLPFFFLSLLIYPCLAFGVPLDDFECITDNAAGDCAAGTSQLSGELVHLVEGEALLTIANDGSQDLVVARIYLESDLVVDLLLSDFDEGSFSIRGGPPLLPGGGRSFEVSFSRLADPAPPKNGIGPGESADFTLVLEDGVSVADLIGDLRIGVHVIAFGDGGSESFVARPIPEPGTAALLAAGLAGTALVRRARRRR